MSMTGWALYAPGDSWVADLVGGPWELEALTEPAGGWHGAFFVHSQEQPWEVERRLRTLSGRAAVPMLACYVETSDFGYALALARGEPVARYVINAHSAEHFREGWWALEQCVALHGRGWQQTAVEALASWSTVAPRPLTTGQLQAILAGRHVFPERPLFGGLGLALGIKAPVPRPLEANVSVFIKGEIPPECHQVVVAGFAGVGVAARVWVGPTRPDQGNVHCLVLARLWLHLFLSRMGSELAGSAHGGLERLVGRLFGHQPKTAQPSQLLVLEDILTKVQVVVTADLPAAAYQRLVAVDLSSIQHGALHYDRQGGQWRAESGPWQQRLVPPANQIP